MLVYKGHQVKVKVTGARKVKRIPIAAMKNFSRS